MKITLKHMRKYANKPFIVSVLMSRGAQKVNNEDLVDFCLSELGLWMATNYNNGFEYDSELHLFRTVSNAIRNWFMPRYYQQAFVRHNNSSESVDSLLENEYADDNTDFQNELEELWWKVVEQGYDEKYAIAMDWFTHGYGDKPDYETRRMTRAILTKELNG